MFFETKTKKLSKNDYFCAIKNMKLPKPSTMNCRYILLFTSVFAFLTSKTDVKAQQNFHFSPRISNLQIRDICQDSLGYLWIATARGVDRYNGYEYAQLFRDESAPETSIQSSRINRLHLDKTGNLWIATSRGLSKYDLTIDKITPYTISNGQDEYFVTDLAEDSTGNLWIATYSNGILKMNRTTDILSPIPLPFGNRASQRAHTLFIDDLQNLWIGYSTGSALGRYNIDDQTAELYTLPDYIEINCLSKFGDSQIWIGTDQGILAYSIKGRKLTSVPPSIRKHPELSAAKINSIKLIDKNNYLITSTHYAYKYCISTGEIAVIPVKSEKNDQNNDITCALKDKQGNLWLGTFEQGIVKVNAAENTFNHPEISSVTLNGKSVTVVCEDKRFGRIWFGSKYDGLYCYSKNGSVKNLTKNNHPALASIRNNSIRALFCDSQNRIWISTGRNLIVGQLNASGFSEITTLQNFGPITAIGQDLSGNIWAGGFSGLYFFGQNVTAEPSQVVKNVTVTTIQPYKADQIVYAAYGQNVFTIDHRDFEPEPLIPEGQFANMHALNACTDIRRSENGSLWIGSYNKGLLEYDPKTRRITKYTYTEGLPSNDILALTEDGNGRIWLATSNGLSRFDPKTKRFRNFNETDGLNNTQFFERAMLTASDGLIYIGGNLGTDCFNPNDVKQNGYHPSVVLEDIKIQNRSVTPGGKHAPIGKSIAYERKITLNHRQNSFSIDYAGIDYNYSDKLRYAYKLDGLDKDWVEAGNNKRASYANVPPGEYRFKLKVQNGDGEWSPETGIDIRIKVSPWLTGWAYALYILLVLAFIITVTKLYFRTKYNKKALALSEKQRLHEQEINQQKIDFYGNISHELRTPLTLINGNIELLAHGALNEDNEHKLITTLSYNSNRLLRLVNQLLDFSRMGNETIPLHVMQTDIVPLIRNVAGSFRFSAHTKEIDYSLHLTEDSLQIYTDEDVLEKILTNLVSNAVKYTPRQGRISIDFRKIDRNTAVDRYPEFDAPGSECLEFRVVNSCKTIDPQQLEHIFDRFRRLENTESTEETPGSGIGLHYTKMLVCRQKGSIKAVFSETEGLVMSFVIPIGREAFPADEIFEQQTPGNLPENTKFDRADFDTPVVQTPSPPKGRTILIVEDDPQIHTLLHEILHIEYDLLHAYNGTEGVQMAREQMPEMIISDIRMPEMDGIALCKTIKNDPQLSHTIFILLTAKNRIEERIEGYNCGADAYISKPFRADHLISVIHSQTNNRDRLKAYFSDKGLHAEQEEPFGDNDRIPGNLPEIDQRFMEKLHSFIDKSIENPDININVIAVELGFSRTSFYRKMKSLTGLAPNDYVRNFKMKKAAKLILEGNLSIAEISDQTGFGTQSHFSTAFKKYFGVSPKDYKEKWKEEHKRSHAK